MYVYRAKGLIYFGRFGRLSCTNKRMLMAKRFVRGNGFSGDRAMGFRSDSFSYTPVLEVFINS